MRETFPDECAFDPESQVAKACADWLKTNPAPGARLTVRLVRPFSLRDAMGDARPRDFDPHALFLDVDQAVELARHA